VQGPTASLDVHCVPRQQRIALILPSSLPHCAKTVWVCADGPATKLERFRTCCGRREREVTPAADGQGCKHYQARIRLHTRLWFTIKIRCRCSKLRGQHCPMPMPRPPQRSMRRRVGRRENPPAGHLPSGVRFATTNGRAFGLRVVMLLCLCLARDATGELDKLARTVDTSAQLNVLRLTATEGCGGVMNCMVVCACDTHATSAGVHALQRLHPTVAGFRRRWPFKAAAERNFIICTQPAASLRMQVCKSCNKPPLASP